MLMIDSLKWRSTSHYSSPSLSYSSSSSSAVDVSPAFNSKEEKQHNPRLQLADKKSYADFMMNLQLPNPKLMDIAVPANQACGNS